MLIHAKIVSLKCETVEIDLDDSMTIDELRDVIAACTDIPEGEQKLYLNSRIIHPQQYADDPEKTLHSVDRAEDVKIFVTQVKAPASSTSQKFPVAPQEKTDHMSSLFDGPLGKMLNNSLIDSLASDPDQMLSIVKKSPHGKHLLRNKVFTDALRDPESLRELWRSVIDPDARKETMRNLELRMSHISNMGGGAMMHSFFKDLMEEDGGDSEDNTVDEARVPAPPPKPTQCHLFETNSNIQPLPNPWGENADIEPHEKFMDPAEILFPGNGRKTRADDFLQLTELPLPHTNDQTPDSDKERFSVQLRELHAMGFHDDLKNISALRQSRGDLHSAVLILLAASGSI